MAITKLVELNNKSRKGLYVRYKHPTGKWSYYKVRPDEPIEKTIQKYTTKHKKREPTKKPRLAKTKKTRRRTIEQQLKKSIKTVKITETTNTALKTAKKRLFQGIIKDPELLSLLTTDHNLQKIKHRFDISIHGYGKEGKLFTANKLNITPDNAVNEAKTLTKGEKIRTNYQSLKKLKDKGWNVTEHQTGTLNNITITITFRKN